MQGTGCSLPKRVKLSEEVQAAGKLAIIEVLLDLSRKEDMKERALINVTHPLRGGTHWPWRSPHVL